MVITAIVLAGGLGTRLNKVVPDLPKPMAPIGDRPFLEILLDYWIGQGVTHFILSVGYKHEVIIKHFGYQYKHATVDYAIEPIPMGTGGGVLLAAQKILPNSSFLVLNGDTYFAIELKKLIEFAKKNDSDWCFSLFKANTADRYMGMEVAADGRINSLVPTKKESQCRANGGVYWVRHQALAHLKVSQDEQISLENDIFPHAILTHQRFFGLVFSKPFIDIGIPYDYQRAQTILSS